MSNTTSDIAKNLLDRLRLLNQKLIMWIDASPGQPDAKRRSLDTILHSLDNRELLKPEITRLTTGCSRLTLDLADAMVQDSSGGDIGEILEAIACERAKSVQLGMLAAESDMKRADELAQAMRDISDNLARVKSTKIMAQAYSPPVSCRAKFMDQNV